jgi:mobilization protein NikA
MVPTALRTAAKLIRFRPDELARIWARARACGRTPARFIRETALGASVTPRREAATDPLLREVAQIGRHLEALVQLGWKS